MVTQIWERVAPNDGSVGRVGVSLFVRQNFSPSR